MRSRPPQYGEQTPQDETVYVVAGSARTFALATSSVLLAGVVAGWRIRRRFGGESDE